MSDYWDHPEYGELEKKFEKQVASTRKWMALHDEAVERETVLSAEVQSKDAVLSDIASQSKSDEFGDDREDADFEGAYDIMIQLARSVSGSQVEALDEKGK